MSAKDSPSSLAATTRFHLLPCSASWQPSAWFSGQEIPPPLVGDAVISARNAALPFVAMLTALLLTAAERRPAVRASLYVVAVAALASLVQYWLPVSFVRDVVAVGAYWSDVKQQGFHLDERTGLPGNFFTSAGHTRLSGPFGDPLSAGYVLAIGFVLAALSQGLRFRVPIMATMGVALVLTFTRGGWIVAAFALLPVAVKVVRAQSWRGRIITMSLGAALCVGLLWARLP